MPVRTRPAIGGAHAELHGVGGVLAVGASLGIGLGRVEFGEGVGVLVEGGEHHAHTRGDEAALEGALAVHEIDGDGGADVDDGAGLLGPLVRRDRVERTVASERRGVVEFVDEGDGQVGPDAHDLDRGVAFRT
jgi:hypothetical protein